MATPTATTQAASNITTTDATLNATVDPQGSAATVTFVFGISFTLISGTTTTTAQPIGGGISAVAVDAPLTGLAAGHHLYNDRVVADHAAATPTAPSELFTTLATPPATTQAATVTPATPRSRPPSIPREVRQRSPFVYGTDST